MVSLNERRIQTTAIFWFGDIFTLTKVQNAHASLFLAFGVFKFNFLTGRCEATPQLAVVAASSFEVWYVWIFIRFIIWLVKIV